MERHDVRLGVVFVGSREFVLAQRRREIVAVAFESERSGAGFESGQRIGFFQLFDDRGFEGCTAEFRGEVSAFELDARARVVPRARQRILGEFAVGDLVGGRRGGFFQRVLPVLRRSRAGEQEQGRCKQEGSFHIHNSSTSRSHAAAEASEGMRQSPRGESDTEPTFGPSGMAERLNCWVKKRRTKTVSHFRMVARS